MVSPSNLPSWQRWPPNCCETCIGWEANVEIKYEGRCGKSDSLNCNDKTDSRFRCPAFERKDSI